MHEHELEADLTKCVLSQLMISVKPAAVAEQL